MHLKTSNCLKVLDGLDVAKIPIDDVKDQVT
jgi:hypothetical protein